MTKVSLLRVLIFLAILLLLPFSLKIYGQYPPKDSIGSNVAGSFGEALAEQVAGSFGESLSESDSLTTETTPIDMDADSILQTLPFDIKKLDSANWPQGAFFYIGDLVFDPNLLALPTDKPGGQDQYDGRRGFILDSRDGGGAHYLVQFDSTKIIIDERHLWYMLSAMLPAYRFNETWKTEDSQIKPKAI